MRAPWTRTLGPAPTSEASEAGPNGVDALNIYINKTKKDRRGQGRAEHGISGGQRTGRRSYSSQNRHFTISSFTCKRSPRAGKARSQPDRTPESLGLAARWGHCRCCSCWAFASAAGISHAEMRSWQVGDGRKGRDASVLQGWSSHRQPAVSHGNHGHLHPQELCCFLRHRAKAMEAVSCCQVSRVELAHAILHAC